MISVRAQVDVINPDLTGCLNGNVITWCKDLGDLEVSYDYVLLVKNTETDSIQSFRALKDRLSKK